jgi:hypothetical protein
MSPGSFILSFSPDDGAVVAEAVARDGAEGVGGEVGGVVHGVPQRQDLERGDEGGPGRGGGVPGEAHADLPARGGHDGLEVRGEAPGVARRRVNLAPPRSLDDLVEHRRRLAAVESAVVVRGADQVPGLLLRGDHVAVLAGRRVREVPEGGEHRHHPWGPQLRHFAHANERPVGDPCHVAADDLLGLRAAVYLVPCARTNTGKPNCSSPYVRA